MRENVVAGERPEYAERLPDAVNLSMRVAGYAAGALMSASVSLRSTHGPHRAPAAAAAVEPVAAIGLEPRHEDSLRHLQSLEHLSRSSIDASHVALLTFPGAVPELSVHPGDAGDEAVRLDGAKDRPRLRIDLMDLPIAMLPDPERSFRPRQPRAAAVRRRDRGDHATRRGIDLLNLPFGDLIEVLAVERRTRVCGDVDRAHALPAHRVDGLQRIPGGEPDVLPI